MDAMDEGYTIAEAAAALGLSPVTVKTQIRAGRLQAALEDTRRGMVWIIAAAEVERYRRESLGKPGSRPKSSR